MRVCCAGRPVSPHGFHSSPEVERAIEGLAARVIVSTEAGCPRVELTVSRHSLRSLASAPLSQDQSRNTATSSVLSAHLAVKA